MKLLTLAITITAAATAAAQTSLDQFIFDDALFGNTLTESDGGAYSSSNWLSTINSNPGNPGLLTGADFNTGIANIGLGTNPIYTIGYNSPIVNRIGDDLGIVVARYSEDTASLAVSTDGTTFTSFIDFAPETAIDTGVHYNYFYGGGGPFEAELFVHSVDLSNYGLAIGEEILAVQVTGSSQLDLVRVAGYAVPEPGAIAASLIGLGLLAGRRRNHRKL